MVVNIGTRVPTVNIAFSSSRNAALIQSKIFQYKTISIKLHDCKLSEVKTQVLTVADVLACLSIPCADQKQHMNLEVLLKSFNIMFQTCVDISNEYLQACNIGAHVKNYLFCSLHQCNCACYTMLLLPFVLSS